MPVYIWAYCPKCDRNQFNREGLITFRVQGVLYFLCPDCGGILKAHFRLWL